MNARSVISVLLAVLCSAFVAECRAAGANRISMMYSAGMVNDRTWHDFYVLHGISIGYGRSISLSKVHPVTIESGVAVSYNAGDGWNVLNVTVPVNVGYTVRAELYDITPYTGFYAGLRVHDNRYGGRYVQPGWQIGLRGGRDRWQAGIEFGVGFFDIAGMAHYNLKLGVSYLF